MRALLRLSVLFCAVLLVVTLASAQGAQLVQNGGFESWITNGAGGPPDDWGIEYQATASQEGTTVHSGSYSVNLTLTDGTSTCDFYQVIPVVADSVYACSLWVYDNDPYLRSRVWFTWQPSGSGGPSTYSTDSPSWELYTWTATAPADAQSLRLEYRLYDYSWGDTITSATNYLDDVVLWGAEPPAINTPPVIAQVYRYPYPTVYPTDFVYVDASITDNEGLIVDDSMYIQVDAGGFSPVYHDSIGTNGKYFFSIGTNPIGTFVEYYVVATDDSAARSESSVYNYTVSNPIPTTVPIADIQFNNTNPGSGNDCYPSDSLGVTVEIVGVVTARYEDPTKHDRYYLQDADSVWSGIYVYNGYSGDTVSVGDNVTVAATVAEYYGLSEMGTITSQVINSQGNPLPAPLVVTCADLGSAGCAAGPEAYEGVFIQINGATVTSDAGNGEFWINDGSGDSCLIYDEVYKNGVDPPTITVGDFCEFIKGVGDYSYSAYKIAPRFSADVSILNIVPIADIQFNNTNPGSGNDCYPSDSLGMTVLINGVVTARYEDPTKHDRYYLQDADSVWSGIYIYNGYSGDTVSVGDNVTVAATVAEYYGLSEMGTITSQTINSQGNPLPAPLVVTCADLGSAGCAAGPEAYEGVFIQINDATVTSDAGNGEFWINDGSGDSCLIYDEVYKNGASPPTVTIGDSCTYIRGVGDYSYSAYKIAPRFSADYYTGTPICSGGNIFDIQYSTDPGSDTADCWPSPDTGTTQTFCGVVTAVTQGSQPRIFMQDQDNTAYGGIYCYDYTTDALDSTFFDLGDYLEVTGHIHDYFGWTEVDTLFSATVLATGQPLPDTLVLTVNDFTPGCNFSTEGYEDVLVRINGVTVLSDNGFGEFWITDASTSDSIRFDSDLWYYGSDQPDPLPSPGATYDWVIGVMKWQGREGGGYERGWILLPRFGSDYESLVVPAPSIVDVWSVDHTTLKARFDRVMDPTTTGNPANYSTNQGLTISGAVLDTDPAIVVLTTSVQPDASVDSLVVSGVCDTSGICITTPVHALFHPGITPLSMVQTPGADGDTSAIYGHAVTLKATIVNDSTMTYPTNLYLNDHSGPPYNGVLTYFASSYTGPWPVLGDTMIITGHVLEYYNSTELSDFSDFNNAVVVGNGGAPEPFEVDAAELYNSLDPAELLEGVLVTVCDTLEVLTTVGEFDAYGFLVSNFASPPDTFIVHHEPGSAGHTRYSYTPVVGDTIDGITGVFRYRHEAYRLMPRGDFDFDTYDTYCGAAGCDYVTGDVNGSSSYNGLDITYGVAYFKGGNDPFCEIGSCPISPCDLFFYCGDVNGSCSYNGLDITYGVAYFKGGALPMPCPSCPPSAGVTGFKSQKPSESSIDRGKAEVSKAKDLN